MMLGISHDQSTQQFYSESHSTCWLSLFVEVVWLYSIYWVSSFSAFEWEQVLGLV